MKEFMVYHAIQSEAELELVKQFLRNNNLPAEDITLANSYYLGYYNTHEVLVGSGGLEFYHDLALLRSLAVSQEIRGQQLGKEIVDQLLKEARQKNVREVYLLTQSASFFFQKMGFKPIDRKRVPEAIRNSGEFATVCSPAAEVLMLKLQ